jgi:hypothetical protein
MAAAVRGRAIARKANSSLRNDKFAGLHTEFDRTLIIYLPDVELNSAKMRLP